MKLIIVFDRIPLYYMDTVLYIDPTTRQTFTYATSISSDNNPHEFIALDLENDEDYILTPKSALQATPTLSEPKEVQSTVTNTFTAKSAGICCNDGLKNFWNRASFAKHSDITLKLLGKDILFGFLAASETHPTDFYSKSSTNR